MTQNFQTFSRLVLIALVMFSVFELGDSQRQQPFPEGGRLIPQRPQQQFPQRQQQQFPPQRPQQQIPQQQQRPQQQIPQQQQQPQQCNIICTAEYNPVCATRNEERRTFDNRCLLRRENQCNAPPQWELFRLGICAPILQT
uniref:Proteinral transcriptional corepressor trfa n=1 Tax=Panstrongylus lignarius TaxID=156445 RepID=A0A224XNI3_9HEMI